MEYSTCQQMEQASRANVFHLLMFLPVNIHIYYHIQSANLELETISSMQKGKWRGAGGFFRSVSQWSHNGVLNSTSVLRLGTLSFSKSILFFKKSSLLSAVLLANKWFYIPFYLIDGLIEPWKVSFPTCHIFQHCQIFA